ncbi:hypothetical protein LY85_2225 [Clostridium sp. KNHs216]|nr:hypothetical protein LY85_2225 [Clostridium sp. KNHs216]
MQSMAAPSVYIDSRCFGSLFEGAGRRSLTEGVSSRLPYPFVNENHTSPVLHKDTLGILGGAGGFYGTLPPLLRTTELATHSSFCLQSSPP